jgi:uncharacterized SAM-binding protein YcdF (DUF218 family)
MLRFLINHLTEPFVATVLLLLLGCVLDWSGWNRRVGRALTLCAALLMLCIAYGVPFDFLARRLENRYHPIVDTDPVRNVHWIVVLGGGHLRAPQLPAVSQAGTATLYRMVEAVRLHRALPGSRILFSGGTTLDSTADAQVSSAAARSIGVETAAVSLSDQPRTTAEEIACIGRIVGAEPFILVTTALHMPRAMALAEGYGLHPIPSPTDFRAQLADRPAVLRVLPRAGAPLLASAAFHEILGLAWLRAANALGRSSVSAAMCSAAPAGQL